MVEKKVQIRNQAGIHCRPSSLIMGAVEQYAGHQFQMESSRGNSNLTSILDLLALGLQKGDTAILKVTGPDEAQACEKIAELLEKEFDFH